MSGYENVERGGGQEYECLWKKEDLYNTKRVRGRKEEEEGTQEEVSGYENV